MNQMIKVLLKKVFSDFGIDTLSFIQSLSTISIKRALREYKFGDLTNELRHIVPDISDQESREEAAFNPNWEIKRRALQAFQVSLMLKALEKFFSSKLLVVDVGDSAGTHMLYLKALTKGRFDIDTISVNIDPRAIEKITRRGLKAINCRAEELDLGENNIDMFTSFEMVEHLHNPAIFFRRLAKNFSSNIMVISLPYLKKSRVGLHFTRNPVTKDIIYAEDEHIFELSPNDWGLLMLHAGWRIVYSEIYFQYPKRVPVLNAFFSWFWKQFDYEGFWGAILQKDTSVSDRYQDWED